jgi:chromosome segregation ATPase
MEFKRLDNLFNQAFQRADAEKPIALDAYKEGPHSADHFLLKKSWDYFKERIQAIEAHWGEIVKAKDDEMSVLREQLRIAREELGEADVKNQMLDKFEEEVRVTRSVDFVNFQKLSDRLKNAWEEERQSLEAQLSSLEHALKNEKENTIKLKDEMAKRGLVQNQSQDVLREENAGLHQKLVASQKALADTQAKKDDEIIQRDSRIELLKAENERLGLVMNEYSQTIDSLGTKVDALLLRIKEGDEALVDRDVRIKHLGTEIKQLQFEKESIKQAWHVEQAQWRELWDRSRQMWDESREKKEER